MKLTLRENIDNLKTAIKALMAAREECEDGDEVATDRLKWTISDLKHFLADEFAFQQAMAENKVAGPFETVLTEIGAKLSQDTRDAIRLAIDALTSLSGDTDTEDQAENYKAVFRAMSENLAEAKTSYTADDEKKKRSKRFAEVAAEVDDLDEDEFNELADVTDFDDEYDEWDIEEAKLTPKARKALAKAQFADPVNRKYPIHDKAHADNAAARLAQQFKAGKVTKAYHDRVMARIKAAQKKFGTKAVKEADILEFPPGSRALRESVTLLGEAEGVSDGTAFNMLVIRAGMSKNRVDYPSDVLKASVDLLNGRPIYIDHPDLGSQGERSIASKVGYWENARFVEDLAASDGEPGVSGIVATAQLYKASPHPWFREMVMESIERGRTQDIGISILAGGKTKMSRNAEGVYKQVKEITVFASADAVAEPGAGGQPLSLAASDGKDNDVDALKKAKTFAEAVAACPDLSMAEIKEARPDLFNDDGTPILVEAKKADEDDEKDDEDDEKDAKKKKKNPFAKESASDDGDEDEDNDDDTTKESVSDVPDAISPADMTKFREGIADMAKWQTQQWLDEALQEANLPEQVGVLVRKRVGGSTITKDEIATLIEEYASVASASAPASIDPATAASTGLSIPFGSPAFSSVQGGLSVEDRVQASLDTWFGAEPEDAKLKEAAKQSPIYSIREFYQQVTGDYQMDGYYHPELSLFREGSGSLPTAAKVVGGSTVTMSNLLGTSMNRALIKFYNDQPRWWEPIVSKVDLSDMKQQDRIRLHNFGSLTERTTDGAEYSELTWSETAESYSPTEYGNLVTVGRRAIINDDLRGIQSLPRLLASSAVLTLNEYVSNLFTQNSGNGPTLADSVQLFNSASHQGNRVTSALSRSTLLSQMKILMKMLNDASKRIGIVPKHLLVPIDLMDTAWELIHSAQVPDSANNAQNLIASGSHALNEPIVVPNWTDANNWYLMADPGQISSIELGFLFGREVPELLSQEAPSAGMVWTHDVLSWKVRWDFGGDWIDYRGAAAAIVA